MTDQPTYPYDDGDVTVLGPEIFASKDRAVISWHGENYVRTTPNNSPTSSDSPDDPLRQQIAAAIRNTAARYPDDIADAVLTAIRPHGKFLGDQLRESEQRLAETRAALDEVLRHFVRKGHPGEPCLQTGWISVKTVERWRAVLYPPTPAPAHDAGPSVKECTDADRVWPLQKHGE